MSLSIRNSIFDIIQSDDGIISGLEIQREGGRRGLASMDVLTTSHIEFLFSADGALLLEDVICWGNWYSGLISMSGVDAETAPGAFEKLFLGFREFRSLYDYRTREQRHLYKFRSEEFPRATELHIK